MSEPCDVWEVSVRDTGERFPCSSKESILRAMLRLGRKGIPVGCVNGGCGVCKVHILSGEFEANGPVSQAHVSPDEEREGYTLACRVSPKTSLTLRVVGHLRRSFSFLSTTTTQPTKH